MSSFLKFRSGKRQLLTCNAYNVCQKRLLNNEISNKQKLVRTLEFKLTSSRNSLKWDVSFLHTTTAFLASNINKIFKVRKVHAKELGNLSFDNTHFESVTPHGINLSNHVLSVNGKSLLWKAREIYLRKI